MTNIENVDYKNKKNLPRPLTDTQIKFLAALSSSVAKGDIRKAMTIAGYSKSTSMSDVVRSLKKEIIAIGEELLAAHTVQAVFGLTDVIDKPGVLGAANKVAAAKEILDRAGVIKKGDDKGQHIQTQNVFILPAKEPIKTIETSYVQVDKVSSSYNEPKEDKVEQDSSELNPVAYSNVFPIDMTEHDSSSLGITIEQDSND